jgi:hypothetical protein
MHVIRKNNGEKYTSCNSLRCKVLKRKVQDLDESGQFKNTCREANEFDMKLRQSYLRCR